MVKNSRGVGRRERVLAALAVRTRFFRFQLSSGSQFVRSREQSLLQTIQPNFSGEVIKNLSNLLHTRRLSLLRSDRSRRDRLDDGRDRLLV